MTKLHCMHSHSQLFRRLTMVDCNGNDTGMHVCLQALSSIASCSCMPFNIVDRGDNATSVLVYVFA